MLTPQWQMKTPTFFMACEYSLVKENPELSFYIFLMIREHFD